MSPLVQCLQALTGWFRSQEELDKAYLNASLDACDVERRMREVARRGTTRTALHLNHGMGLH